MLYRIFPRKPIDRREAASMGSSLKSEHYDTLESLNILSFSISESKTCIRYIAHKEFCQNRAALKPVLAKTLAKKEKGEWVIYVRSHVYRKDWAHLEQAFMEFFEENARQLSMLQRIKSKP